MDKFSRCPDIYDCSGIQHAFIEPDNAEKESELDRHFREDVS